MQYVQLGERGPKVSTIGFGAWAIGGVNWGPTDDQVSKKALRQALDLGVTLIDTADVYHQGEAEKVYGRELSPFRRQDIVLATKCFFPMSDGINDRGLSRKHILESVEGSLKRLQTSYIDLYQCHRYDPEVELFEVIRAMDDLIRQGKILYWIASLTFSVLIRIAILMVIVALFDFCFQKYRFKEQMKMSKKEKN